MHPVLLIVFLPLLAAIIAGLFGRLIGNTAAKVVTTASLFAGALLSWPIFLQYVAGDAGATVVSVIADRLHRRRERAAALRNRKAEVLAQRAARVLGAQRPALLQQRHIAVDFAPTRSGDYLRLVIHPRTPPEHYFALVEEVARLASIE